MPGHESSYRHAEGWMILRLLPARRASWRLPSRRRAAIYVSLLGAVVAVGLAGPPLVARVLGPPSTMSVRAAKGGALLICGGGKMPAEVRSRFLELAGGPHAEIVVIPTAHAAADSPQ